MKSGLLSVLAIIAVLFAFGCRREPGQDGSLLISGDAMLIDTSVLAADEMEGRRAGTPGAEKAAAYIAGRFREIGLQPVAGSYFQSVEMVGMLPGVMPPTSTWCARLASRAMHRPSANTGVSMQRSGRWEPLI